MIQDMFNLYVTIEEVTRTPDGQGGQAESWAEYITDLHGRMRKTTAREREEYMKLEVAADFLFDILPQELDITENNHRLTFNDGFNDRIFDIVHVDKWNFAGHHWILALFEQKV